MNTETLVIEIDVRLSDTDRAQLERTAALAREIAAAYERYLTPARAFEAAAAAVDASMEPPANRSASDRVVGTSYAGLYGWRRRQGSVPVDEEMRLLDEEIAQCRRHYEHTNDPWLPAELAAMQDRYLRLRWQILTGEPAPRV